MRCGAGGGQWRVFLEEIYLPITAARGQSTRMERLWELPTFLHKKDPLTHGL
jgi:hypothetical protein